MGFLDFLKGSKSAGNSCVQCEKEGELPFSKKLDGELKHFCSKQCSSRYRIARKKRAKNPPTSGRSMPW